MFAADGTTIYSDVRSRIGDVVDGDGFRRARGGRLVSAVERETGDHGEHVATSLEVYVPLRLPGGADVDGVTELYVDYGPTAAAIHDDTRTLYLLLLGGFAVLWLSLFSIVRGASRRLRHQALHDTLTGLPNRDDACTSASARIDRRRARVRRALRAAPDRPRPLQGGQRHARPRSRRHAAARRRRPAAGALRRGDTLARLGGDEFAVLLPTCPTARRPPSSPAACSARWSGRSSCAA